MARLKRPTPLFDTLSNFKSESSKNPLLIDHPERQKEFELAIDFIKQYDGSEATFRSYRREIERLLQWTWLVADKSILELKRQDIEHYIEFCKKPPKSWIGVKNVARFVTKDDQRVPNPEWRLFVASVNKADFKKGIRADKTEYALSQKSIREIFTVTSSFYSHLMNEGAIDVNPVLLIRQKSKYFMKRQSPPKIPRLTERQWNFCIKVAEELAAKN
ncbi:MAG: site-specific integrase, partial [Gammaproteobacteria bacterium]|nr:site-specific integrase [Gammaproteobacteria bacterium]